MVAKILVVDDDVNICELLRLYLTKEGFEVTIAHNGTKAMELFALVCPNLAILDIMLPGMDGFQLCRNIRSMGNVPIIMLTAKGETFDKVSALEFGADDYMVKPFDGKELVARVKAVLRRSSQIEEDTVAEIIYEKITINLANYTLLLEGVAHSLPPKELELLYFLANNPNKVYTREQLLSSVWGYDYFGDSRTVDVHIKRLREKILGISEKWELKTVWGVGYKFETRG